KMREISQPRSLCWRVAKMRFVRRVGSCVIEHRIDCSSQRLEFHNSREDRAVANLGVDYERWSLRYLERAKFSRRCANAFFGFRRSRAFAEAPGVVPARCGPNFDGNVPVPDLFPSPQRGMS